MKNIILLFLFGTIILFLQPEPWEGTVTPTESYWLGANSCKDPHRHIRMETGSIALNVPFGADTVVCNKSYDTPHT